MLILSILFGAFRPPKPENRILPAVRTGWPPDMARCYQFLFSALRKNRGGSARCGLRWWKGCERHGQDKHPWGPSTPRHEALCQATNL
jgi:hypothetical protein